MRIVYVPDLGRKYPPAAVNLTVVKVASPHRDQKSAFTYCVISSWEVLISYRASDTSYLAGRLTGKGIFRRDSANECSTRAITWPTLHMEEEKSHLSVCDCHFHLCSLQSLFSVSPFLSFLEIITSHVRSSVGWKGEKKCVTPPLKFLIV